MKKTPALIFGGIISTAIAYFLVYMMGRGKTHASGLDFSHYATYCLFYILGIAVPGIIGGYVMYRIVMGRREDPLKEPYIDKKDGKRKMRDVYPSLVPAILVIVAFSIVGIYAMAGLATLLRAYVFNAESADIQIDVADSGDFQLKSATTQDYRDKNLVWKLITLEERYRLVFEINCTNFTNSTQLYNDTTATIVGFNDKKESVTGTYSPETQPGSFTLTSGALVVVFVDIPQQSNNPMDVITYYNLTLKNSDGLLASWIIHTDPKLSYWTADIQS